MNNDQKAGGVHCACLIAAACCAISAVLMGLTINCASIFFDSVNEESGVGRGDFVAYASIFLFVSTMTFTVADKVYSKHNARAIVLINVIIVSFSFAAMPALNFVYQFYSAVIFSGIAMVFLFFPLILQGF